MFPVVDKTDIFPFSHKLQHIFGPMVVGDVESAEIRSKDVGKIGSGCHQGSYVKAVVLKIGGKKEVAAGLQVDFDEIDKITADQTSFAMPLFWAKGPGSL